MPALPPHNAHTMQLNGWQCLWVVHSSYAMPLRTMKRRDI
jgi:hypothetical protein